MVLSFPSTLVLPIPPHLQKFNEDMIGMGWGIEELMMELITFGHLHIRKGGGPFVAAIQEIESEKVVCVGANLVVLGNQSWAHGERVAISLAQQLQGNFQLPKGLRMLTTAQMCIACYGETLCSGLEEVHASCTGADVEQLTPFTEGILPDQWQQYLAKQGCTYFPDVAREKGRELLAAYGKNGIPYFNAGSGS